MLQSLWGFKPESWHLRLLWLHSTDTHQSYLHSLYSSLSQHCSPEFPTPFKAQCVGSGCYGNKRTTSDGTDGGSTGVGSDSCRNRVQPCSSNRQPCSSNRQPCSSCCSRYWCPELEIAKVQVVGQTTSPATPLTRHTSSPLMCLCVSIRCGVVYGQITRNFCSYVISCYARS